MSRDMNKICSVGDIVFNQSDSKLYTIAGIQNNTFTCADFLNQDISDIQAETLSKAAVAMQNVDVMADIALIDFDITQTTFTKVLRS